MNIEHFPFFMKVVYPEFEISDTDIKEIASKFKEYLEDKFKDKQKNLQEIWDIEPMKVMLNQNHPLFTKGYHPAFILHFHEFIKQNI